MTRFVRSKLFIALFGTVLFIIAAVWWLAQKERPEKIIYGMSFNTFYAEELGLPWQEVYDAIIDELGVRHLRLAAHWPMIEPRDDVYDFSKLDHQVDKAEAVGGEVIMAVGRRLPRWPECHVPDWAKGLTIEEQQTELLEYMSLVINRYKEREVIMYWQIENEPFLEVFAYEHCGELDEEFFAEQVALARSLDPERQLLVTDSGNLGSWYKAYKYGDVFGSSVYIYFWNPELGQFRTVLPPWFYRLKENVMKLVYGDRETFLIELSAEPWLVEPIADVPIETQYSRMDLEKFEDILTYAEATRFERQYLWGAEWWYWLKEKGHSEMWDRGVQLFDQQTP